MAEEQLVNTEVSLEDIKKREAKFQDIYDRQDASEALYFLEKFTLSNLEDDEPTPNVQNVTLNDPQTFAKKAISALTKAEQVIEITGKKMTDTETHPIELFGTNVLTAIDERLTNMGEVGLFPTQCERVCIRGSIAARVGVRGGKGGTVLWDVMPWDTRFYADAVAPDGMKWASYTTTKDKDMVQAEHGFAMTDDEASIRDVLTRQKEYIYVNDELKKTMTHGLGYVPVIFSGSSSGTTLKTASRAKNIHDDIFSSVRDLYEQLNICATVLQTMNIMALRQCLLRMS